MSFSKWMKEGSPDPSIEIYKEVEGASLSSLRRVLELLKEGEPRRAAAALSHSFSWRSTPQGWHYWLGINIGDAEWSEGAICFVEGLCEYLKEKRE